MEALLSIVTKAIGFTIATLFVADFVSQLTGRPPLWDLFRKWQLEYMFGPLEGIQVRWATYGENNETVYTSHLPVIYYWKAPLFDKPRTNFCECLSAGAISRAFYYGISQGIVFYTKDNKQCCLRINQPLKIDEATGLRVLPVVLFDNIPNEQFQRLAVPRIPTA